MASKSLGSCLDNDCILLLVLLLVLLANIVIAVYKASEKGREILEPYEEFFPSVRHVNYDGDWYYYEDDDGDYNK